MLGNAGQFLLRFRGFRRAHFIPPFLIALGLGFASFFSRKMMPKKKRENAMVVINQIDRPFQFAMCLLFTTLLLLFSPVLAKVDEDQAISRLKHIKRNKNLKPKIRIIGGDSAPEGRYPYAHVTLQMDDGHQCGGSLIAPDIILTAAHCRGWYDTVHVDRQNIIDALDTYEAFEAADVILHPQFEPVLYRYDFALVKMHQPVQNRNLQPIRLDDGSTFLKADDELTILGWGAITDHEQTNPAYPNVLQKGKVGYMQNDICEFTKVGDYFLYKDEIFPEMICAKSNDGVDACKGDSGGPLIKESSVPSQDVQVGLMSWGRGCGVYPGVYSRIASEYDWIRQNVCSASKDPPSYMNCQPDERSSYDVMGSIAWPASTVTVTTTESNEANDGNRRRASTAPDLSAGQSIIVAGHAILLPLILLAMLA